MQNLAKVVETSHNLLDKVVQAINSLHIVKDINQTINDISQKFQTLQNEINGTNRDEIKIEKKSRYFELFKIFCQCFKECLKIFSKKLDKKNLWYIFKRRSRGGYHFS